MVIVMVLTISIASRILEKLTWKFRIVILSPVAADDLLRHNA